MLLVSVGTALSGTHGEFLPKYDWTVHRFQNMAPLLKYVELDSPAMTLGVRTDSLDLVVMVRC